MITMFALDFSIDVPRLNLIEVALGPTVQVVIYRYQKVDVAFFHLENHDEFLKLFMLITVMSMKF